MYHVKSVTVRATCAGLAFAALLSALPRTAGADESCRELIANKVSSLPPDGHYLVDVTIHREDIDVVSYGRGAWTLSAPPALTGGGFHVFSRLGYLDEQFDFSPWGTNILWLSPTGLLWIFFNQPTSSDEHVYRDPQRFNTIVDLSCKGTIMTGYVPGYGVVTLAFRGLVPRRDH